MQPTLTDVRQAMRLVEFRNWQPPFARRLNRPLARPDHLAGNGLQAGVLLLLLESTTPADRSEDAAAERVVLIRRTDSLTKHAGQMAFPGGRIEPNETAQQAALRETTEEIGVDARTVEVLGELNSIYIPPSDFTVQPFVGWCKDDPQFRRQESEVAEIVVSDLNYLMSPAALQREVLQVDGQPVDVPFYHVAGHKVWGATAVMLFELIERIRAVGRRSSNPAE